MSTRTRIILDLTNVDRGWGVATSPRTALGSLRDLYDKYSIYEPIVDKKLNLNNIGCIRHALAKLHKVSGKVNFGAKLFVFREPRGVTSRRSMFVQKLIELGVYTAKKKIKKQTLLGAAPEWGQPKPAGQVVRHAIPHGMNQQWKHAPAKKAVVPPMVPPAEPVADFHFDFKVIERKVMAAIAQGDADIANANHEPF